MKISRKWQAWIFSSLGVIVLAVLAVVVNVIAWHTNRTLDLTEDGLYTLNAGSRRIIADLQAPVTIRFYCTRDIGKDRNLATVASYTKRVDDFLKEYERAGNGKIKVERINPAMDTDEEDKAAVDGIDQRPTSTGDRFYFGLVVQQIDATERLPYLEVGRENSLEYDITRLIYRVSHPDKPTIGIMSSLDVFGTGSDNPNSLLTQSRAWLVLGELRRDYEVQPIELGATEIPDTIKVLVIIHPKGISQQTLYAIDQYLLRGGRVIAYVDPVCAYDAVNDPTARYTGGGQPGISTLDPLFAAWGLTFNTDLALADSGYATPRSGTPWLTGLTITPDGMNRDDVVTAHLNVINVAHAGVFTGSPVNGLTSTVLLHSSKASELIQRDLLLAPNGMNKIMTNFLPSDTEYPIAMRLTGTFPTAFPGGRPPPPEAKKKPKPRPGTDDEAASDAAITDIATSSEADANQLHESREPGTVLVVGDVDWLADQSWAQRIDDAYGRIAYMPRFDNGKFLLNAVEHMSGSSDLIAIRSRGITSRPFKAVQEINRQAAKLTAERKKQAQEEYNKASRELGELRTVNQDGQRTVVLTDEQQAKITELKKKLVEIAGNVRDLEKQERRAVNALEKNLTWANIGLVPFLIVHLGLILILLRRRRQQSR